ncbi:DegV family protein [Secundilactobacillus folii]|uniref:DegV family EDD domain-containing protein n=1 Tax=Secundilactobacillus folii TaxID=2678357 RepID=A0A7X2XW88_9LACO|nr:DegV family protein [Secundilactobacillus folii]MTV82063.1 DegV family EDD domain-containing protein [Secundilactobacillus folii]
MSIQIVTDSTVQLTDEELATLPITVVPLIVRLGTQEFLNDGVQITNAQFLSHLVTDEELPKTSQPSIGQFLEVFDRLGENGDEVLCLNLTHFLSGTVNAARQAAEMSDTKVTVIDSLSIDRGLAFQVITAAKLAQNGAPMETILNAIELHRSHTEIYVFLNTLENLIKGGRISRAAGGIANLLNIKVVAELTDGELRVAARGRGKRFIRKEINELVDRIKTEAPPKVGLTHVDNLTQTSEIANRIKEALPDTQVTIHEAGPVISTYTSVGALAIEFYTD